MNGRTRTMIGRGSLLALALLGAAVLVAGGPLSRVARHLVGVAYAEDGGGSGGSGGGDGGGGSGGGDGSSSGGGGSGSSGSGGDDGSGDDGGNSGKGKSGSSGTTSGTTTTNGGVTANNPAGSGGRGDFAAGEVVVLGDRPEVLAKAEGLGFRLIDDRPLQALGLSVLRLKTPVNVDSQAGLALLRQAVPELVADVNSFYEPYKAQAAEVVSLPAPDYARHLIGWSGNAGCGAGLRIGMVDSGIDAGLPALAGQRLHQQTFLSPGSTAAASDHGTAIATLLLGRPDPAHLDGAGLLPAADLYAASIFERHGERSEASAFGIAAALDWMVAQHVPVVNISLSGDDNALMALAVSRASERGTVLVAAAGNAGPGAPPAYPAAFPSVIAVTAVDQDDAILPEANRGDYVAFAAPGVRIWTPDGQGAGQYRTGTSFAAPFAAAAIAAEHMAGAPADVNLLRQRLAARAIDLGAPGKDPVFGYGLIQASGTCGASASAQ
ncbi:MAG TPA: S8 family serine peptidase [Dongiaceae bacterium]|nr:S8 family serine peptidase [Dongiaceae bacterium]